MLSGYPAPFCGPQRPAQDSIMTNFYLIITVKVTGLGWISSKTNSNSAEHAANLFHSSVPSRKGSSDKTGNAYHKQEERVIVSVEKPQ